MHDNAVLNFSMVCIDQMHGERINTFDIQSEKNKKHMAGNFGRIQQSVLGKSGEKNNYHREFLKNP